MNRMNRTIRARIHESAVKRVTRIYAATLADIFAETLQNSRRAGAVRVHITVAATAMGRPAESVTLGTGDVRYERRRGSTRDAVHSGLGTAARAAGDILLENAPSRPTVRIPRDTELIVMFASSTVTAPENGPDRANVGAGDG